MKQSGLVFLGFTIAFIFCNFSFTADIKPQVTQFEIGALTDNIATSNMQRQREIVEMSVHFLTTIEKVKNKAQLDPLLIKKIGAAYGQISYSSPITLQFFDDLIIEFLKLGKLTYKDLKTPHYEYKFGQKYSREYMGSEVLQTLKNGQTLSGHYHWNYPLFFNRLLGEFSGDSLLIGGGENCECGHPENHPKSLFYRVDLENKWQPDVVLHAGYLEHLTFFPTHRFGFIWFEHCTVGELLQLKVFAQYFRFSKPGAVFLLQTNFIVPGYEETVRLVLKDLKNMLTNAKFVVLEHKEGLRHGGNASQTYDQLIVMKPFLKNPQQEIDPSPLAPIKIDDYVPAIEEVQYKGLFRALLLSNQFDQVKEMLSTTPH